MREKELVIPYQENREMNLINEKSVYNLYIYKNEGA